MDTRTALAMDHEALATLLAHQRDLLDRLLTRHVTLRVLLESGETRFVGRALDEVDDIEWLLGTSELLRAATSERLALEHGLPLEDDLDSLTDTAPPHLQPVLSDLGAAVRSLLEATGRERRLALAAAGKL